MDIKAIFFDVNGTLIDILTDEGLPDIYRKIRNFLGYQGIFIHKSELRNLYYQIMKEQKTSSKNTMPEYDATGIWRRIIELKQTDFTRSLPPATLEALPFLLAQMHRAFSLCRKLQVYPDVYAVLDKLYTMYPLALISDAQSAYAKPELNRCGLLKYFNPIIISGDYGYRKPDPRLFKMALDHHQLDPKNVIFVGNDMYNDVYGAKKLGMRSIFFASNQGDHNVHDGVQPDYIIRQFSELLTAIEFLKNTNYESNGA